MSQETINHILHNARLSGEAIDCAYLQNTEELPEYSNLLLAEKNALALMNSDSIIAFLSSAELRRKNAEDGNQISAPFLKST